MSAWVSGRKCEEKLHPEGLSLKLLLKAAPSCCPWASSSLEPTSMLRHCLFLRRRKVSADRLSTSSRAFRPSLVARMLFSKLQVSSTICLRGCASECKLLSGQELLNIFTYSCDCFFPRISVPEKVMPIFSKGFAFLGRTY